MRAIAVLPGKPNSIHLAELPKPSVHEIPNGRGVLVQVLRVGVDGTDKEINAAEYGQAPPGYDFLVIGHECFGRVLEVGPNVTEFVPGNYVVPTVRRPGGGGTTAAKRLFGKVLRESDVPENVTMDKSGANNAAIAEIHASKNIPIVIRQVKGLNNLVEQDHRTI